jgi:hypothetical protein
MHVTCMLMTWVGAGRERESEEARARGLAIIGRGKRRNALFPVSVACHEAESRIASRRAGGRCAATPSVSSVMVTYVAGIASLSLVVCRPSISYFISVLLVRLFGFE